MNEEQTQLLENNLTLIGVALAGAITVATQCR